MSSQDRVFDYVCTACQASYKVVRCPGPSTASLRLSCLVCGEHFAPQDDDDILKYFLIVRGSQTSGEGPEPGKPAKAANRLDKGGSQRAANGRR